LATALNVRRFCGHFIGGISINTLRKQNIFPSLDNLHDPYLMKDMERPERIEKAIENEENILVLAIMMLTHCCFCSFLFKTYYPNVATYIPDRYRIKLRHFIKGIDLQMTMVFAY
jgi:single-stranded-DNA-specific exonuclease